ncbi:MAG: glycosyltransferase [Candidatus Eremiobacteraeota bacterium]|nr:glycosyltransferase [Candidatus Eremiobacteraeota bacterium]
MDRGKASRTREAIEVSLIIPSAMAHDGLRHTLQNAALLMYPPRQLEVIVVNNSEKTIPEEWLLALPFSHKVVTEKKRCRAAARNRGIRESRGRLLIFLDDDVLPEPQLAKAHWEMHLRYPGSAVLGEVLPCPGTSPADRLHLAETFRGQHDGKALEYGTVTCNLSVHREAIEKAGFFDEQFTLYGFEDLELGFRLVKDAGVTLRYAKGARAWHYRELSIREACTNYFQAGASFVRFILKHPAALKASAFPTITGHLRETLARACSFRAYTAREASAQREHYERLERICLETPGESAAAARDKACRSILDYSFIEGAFLAARRIKGPCGPLLQGEEASYRGYRIFWHGPTELKGGFGTVSRQCVKALGELGHGLTVCDREGAHPRGAALSRESHHLYFHHYWKGPLLYPVGPYRIQVSACETTVIPHETAAAINSMHEAWVPSEFCRESFFNSGVRVPVHILPYAVDMGRFAPSSLRRRYFPDSRFCFMALGSLYEYKGFDILVRAYYEEFRREDDVLLALKVKPHGALSPLAAREAVHGLLEGIRRSVKKKSFPPLFLYYEDLADEELADFIGTCHAYVVPSRGEGFCLPALEALSLGRPVIATAFGGHLDFLSEDNSYLVEYRLVEASSRDHGEHRQGLWAEPSREHLRALMRHVYEHREEALLKAARGQLLVRRSFTLKNLRERIAARLEAIYHDYGKAMENLFHVGGPQ